MLHPSFNRNLHRLINKIAWPFFLIEVHPERDCSCLDKQSNRGDPVCPYCLGTGHMIKIRKIMAVKQPYKARNLDVTDLDVNFTTYFIDAKYAPIKLGDMVVLEDEVDVIKLVKIFCSDSGMPQYFECPATYRRHGLNPFLKNFKHIVEDKS